MEGCQKPLIVWKETSILLDGHNSLEIYKKHGISYQILEMKFPNRELAIEWVIDNQLGRRNLSPERCAYFMGKEYLRKKQAEPGQKVLPDAHSAHPDGTAEKPGDSEIATTTVSEEVAAKHGVNQATVRRNADFAKGVDSLSDEAKKQVLDGNSTATKAEIASSIFCSRCRRVGPVKDCPNCAQFRTKAGTPKPSDGGGGGKKPKAGAEKFSWRDYDKHLGHVIRGVDDIEKAYETCDEIIEVRSLLQRFVKVWKGLHRRLTKGD
jgi:hypothetical protein